MKVLWTASAVSQLQAINHYIAQTSPDYAHRLTDRLTRRSVQISLFPFSGRMVPEYELNEVREVLEGRYRLIYLIDEVHDTIEILAIMHGSRETLKPLG